MNILNVTSIREWRGGDKQMYTIFRLLENEPDIKQFILCPEGSALAKMCEENGSAFYTYKKNRFKLINAAAKIINICKKEDIDVLHIHDSSALNSALLAIRFLPGKVKLILSRKRNNAIKKKFLNYYKYSHHKIFRIISVSKAVERIFDNIVTDKSRLITIYDAIDVQKYASAENRHLLHIEYNIPGDTKIIGNIAGLTHQKDLVTFLDAARLILDTKPDTLAVKFVIIGDGPQRENLEEYRLAKKLQDDVIFTGFRNNVNQLLPELDVFLMSSVTEGLPLTIYEAFASRIPVVSTSAGGVAEVVKNYETGFVTPLKDAGQLADRVLEILKNPVLKQKMTLNAFEMVRKNHDLHALKKNYYNFYKSLA